MKTPYISGGTSPEVIERRVVESGLINALPEGTWFVSGVPVQAYLYLLDCPTEQLPELVVCFNITTVPKVVDTLIAGMETNGHYRTLLSLLGMLQHSTNPTETITHIVAQHFLPGMEALQRYVDQPPLSLLLENWREIDFRALSQSPLTIEGFLGDLSKRKIPVNIYSNACPLVHRGIPTTEGETFIPSLLDLKTIAQNLNGNE